MNFILLYYYNIAALVLVILSFHLNTGVFGLRLLRVTVPEYVELHEQVTLKCDYDLESDKLYSITWYKDNDEFYRYVPKSEPPQLTYFVDDIKVDLVRSNEKKVTLRNVSLRTSGIYRCEVSAEAPSFTTVNADARMEIVSLPRDEPQISGGKKEYEIGETISLNCTSSKSHPAAKLTWFINDQEVATKYETMSHQHGFKSSKSRLVLKASPEHFVNGRMDIRCQATISIGNHSILSLPIPRNNTKFLQPLQYKKNALISAIGLGYTKEGNILLIAVILYIVFSIG